MLTRKAVSCNLLHPWHALAEVKQVAGTTWERAVAHTNIIVPGVFAPYLASTGRRNSQGDGDADLL